MRLKDQVAVITGSSRGIGRAIALDFAKAGAKVIVNYRSSEQKAQEVVELIQDLGGAAFAVQANVCEMDEVKSMFKEAQDRFGQIDIVVNNAGITRDKLLLRMKEEDWDTVLNINLKGTFNCTQAVTKIMMKQKSGKIINISSVVGMMGNAGQANYAASKAGVIGFTKSVAKELASRSITVNAIAPGFIKSEMTEELSSEIKEQMLELIPLARFGNPEDVAHLATFLASKEADYITGQVINVAGGLVM